MKTAIAEPRRHGLTQAPRDLVAYDDGGQHIFPARAQAFGHSERNSGQRGAGMHNVAQVAIVGRGRVAQHRVHPRHLCHG